MNKIRRSLALMGVFLAAGLLSAQVRADDTPAQPTPEPHTFRTELPEDEVTGETPKEVDGFWKIPGKRSWLKLGGFVMLDVIHDFDAIGSKTDFVPSTIPVDGGTPSEGSDGRTTFSYRQTRLFLDSRTAAGSGMIRAYASVDFFGGDDDDPQLRIRHAGLRMERLVGGGDLTIAQTWTFFMDSVALPETLDYEGPAGCSFTRQALVGWRKSFGAADFGVSAEKPTSSIEGADGLTNLPDLVVAGRWQGDRWGHVRLAAVGRQLRASLNDGPVATAPAGGLTVSGLFPFGKRRDDVSFQVVFGNGVGRYLDDPVPDAIYDPAANDLKTLTTLSGFVSFRHRWSDMLRTTLVFSVIDVDNDALQTGEDLESEQYAAVNLIWSPYKALDLGVEVLHGQRKNIDGDSGSATRLQFSGKYAF